MTRPLPRLSLLGACATVLVVPLLLPPAAAARPQQPVAAAPVVDGIQSLPLRPLAASTLAGGAADQQPEVMVGLPATQTEPFSLLGAVWTDPLAELDGQVQVRTRARESGIWSTWQPLPAGEEHAPDPGTTESGGTSLRGGTAPLWVGDSDAVQAQVVHDEESEAADDGEGGEGAGGGGGTAVQASPEAAGEPSELPDGLRLELIDPGPVDQGERQALNGGGQAARTDGVNGEPATSARRPGVEQGPAGDDGDGGDEGGGAVPLPAPRTLAADDDHVGPRPPIVTRSGWGADESLRESGFVYTDTIRTAFVHHTAGSNDYACKDAPAVIRSIYRYHVSSLGWRDVGYNFFVDRCGTIYEGRAGGVAEPVQGAHTYGHNHNSMGVAVIGSYDSTDPSKRAIEGVSLLIAWKLGLFGTNPANSNERVSGGGRYAAGTKVRMENVSGHRDGYATECPGDRLYAELPTIRDLAARLQGR